MKQLRLLLIPFVLLTVVACEDEKEGCMDPISLNYDPDAEKDNGTCQYAGQGGGTEMVFFPIQDTVDIISTNAYRDTAYLKFNATSFPGADPGAYDLIYPGDIGENHIHFYNMKTGHYYLYMTGWNFTTNKRVTGHTAITLTKSAGVIYYDVTME